MRLHIPSIDPNHPNKANEELTRLIAITSPTLVGKLPSEILSANPEELELNLCKFATDADHPVPVRAKIFAILIMQALRENFLTARSDRELEDVLFHADLKNYERGPNQIARLIKLRNHRITATEGLKKDVRRKIILRVHDLDSLVFDSELSSATRQNRGVRAPKSLDELSAFFETALATLES